MQRLQREPGRAQEHASSQCAAPNSAKHCTLGTPSSRGDHSCTNRDGPKSVSICFVLDHDQASRAILGNGSCGKDVFFTSIQFGLRALNQMLEIVEQACQFMEFFVQLFELGWDPHLTVTLQQRGRNGVFFSCTWNTHALTVGFTILFSKAAV